MTRRLSLFVALVLCVAQAPHLSAQGSPIRSVYGMGSASNTPPVPEGVCTITGPGSWPDVTEGVAAPTVTIETTNCTAPVACTVTTGALPTGIIESAECVYSDDPMAAHTAGTTAITITATPAMGVADTQNYSIVIGSAGSGIPDGWESGDIGSLGLGGAGTVTYDDNGDMGESVEDIWTLTTTAPNIISTSDSFRYACKTLDGDGTILAEVTGLTGYTFAQAGVMVRKDLTATSPHMFSYTFPIGGGQTNQRKYRAADSGATTNENTGLTANYWVRVSRVGDVLTGYVSTTGADDAWVQASSSQTIDLDTTAYYCLAVTSIGGQSTLADADFENVEVTTVPPVEPEEPDFGGYRSHLQGFGASTVGGRGDATKRTCAINSLLNTAGNPTLVDAGTQFYRGTFRQCAMGATDMSFIVCEVSGNADIGLINITNPYLTIAMQTCPAPGLTFRNGYFTVNTHNVVFQHVRLRCGASTGNTPGSVIEGFYIKGQSNPVFNVILDHVSVTWCGHLGIGMHAFGGANTTQPQDILIVDTLNAEHFAVNPSSICTLYFGATNGTTTYARNYHTNCANRNPWVGSGWRADVYNNVTVGPKTVAGSDGAFGFVQLVNDGGSYPDAVMEVAYIGNINISGPSTASPDGTVGVNMDASQVAGGGAELYLLDNTGPGITNNGTFAGQAAGVFYQGSANSGNSLCDQACFDSTFTWTAGFNYEILDDTEVAAHITANVGARPSERDSVDTRLIGYIASPSSSNADWGDHENDVGGFPSLAANTQTFTLPMTPYGAGDCGSVTGGTARLAVECTLEDAARALEPRWTP